MVDWDHAYKLLHIANLARQWPNLQWLHDAAMSELQRGRERAVESGPVPVAGGFRHRIGEDD